MIGTVYYGKEIKSIYLKTYILLLVPALTGIQNEFIILTKRNTATSDWPLEVISYLKHRQPSLGRVAVVAFYTNCGDRLGDTEPSPSFQPKDLHKNFKNIYICKSKNFRYNISVNPKEYLCLSSGIHGETVSMQIQGLHYGIFQSG